MDLKQLTQKSPTELQSHLLDLRREQFSLRMQKGTGQLSQTHQLRNVRREIAQVKTLLGANK
jgi:large subunit ribosomal protein L29